MLSVPFLGLVVKYNVTFLRKEVSSFPGKESERSGKQQNSLLTNDPWGYFFPELFLFEKSEHVPKKSKDSEKKKSRQ